MTIDTWVSLATILVALGTFYGFMSRRFTRLEDRLRAEIRIVDVNLRAEIRTVDVNLRGEIRTVDANLRGEIAELRAELRAEIAGVRADLKHLDDRVYALAAGLRPQLGAPEHEQA